MVKLYSSQKDPSTLAILITSLSVGIPKLECFVTEVLPYKIINENAEAFHVSLPFLNIDKRNNVSSVNAILLYLASLQEKLQLVTGVDTMSFLDLTSQTSDAIFLEELETHIDVPDAFLEKRDTWTLADVAVYARLKGLSAQGLVKNDKFVQWMQCMAKDKFFQEGEARFASLLNEAIVQIVSLLNTGKFWELSKEEQTNSLEILLAHYKEQLPALEKRDQERKSKLGDESKEELSKGASSDLDAYKKVIATYELSLCALKSQ